MIVVNARLIVKPERRDEVVTLVKSTLEVSRAEEGCITYRFYQDAENEDAFIFEEEWENQEVLNNHWRTEHVGKLFAAAQDALIEPPEFKIYEVSSKKGMEAVEAALS